MKLALAKKILLKTMPLIFFIPAKFYIKTLWRLLFFMNFKRFLSEKSIRLNIVPSWSKVEETTQLCAEKGKKNPKHTWQESEDYDPYQKKEKKRKKQEVVQVEETENIEETEEVTEKPSMLEVQEVITSELAELLNASGKVGSLSKLKIDLFNIVKRNFCVLGYGVAVPHVRCWETKNIIMGFARYTEEIDFQKDAPLVRIFIPMIAPVHENISLNKEYLAIYSVISKALLDSKEPTLIEELLRVEDPNEVIQIFNQRSLQVLTQ
jgi:mannitol/fructose-specific phosphotransferase system IIA component (Ntr-type)